MQRKPGSVQLSMDDLRVVGLWAADCAERVLPLFEAQAGSDSRPQEAINGIRTFAQNGKRTAHLRSLAIAAHASARAVGDPAAAAARAAGLAAAVAYMHPLADPLQARHALGSAVYAALACELAADQSSKAAEKEIRWARNRASAEVGDVVARYPAQSFGRSRLAMLFFQLDASFRI